MQQIHQSNKKKINTSSTPARHTFQKEQSINISSQTRIFIYLLTIVVLILTLILNAIWQDSLYAEGLFVVLFAQSNFNHQIFKVINNIFSLFGNPVVVCTLIFIEICFARHKFSAMIHISFLLFSLYILAFLKLAFQQSRPIWTWDKIHKWEWFCPKDFGNPSGHSFIIFPLYQSLLFQFIKIQKLRSIWGMSILLVLFGFFIPFSRTYLGMHSVNQIMFGLTLGIVSTILYRYGLREWFFILYSRIFKLKKIKYLFLSVISHIILLVLPFLFFQLYTDNRPLQQKDLINLNRICSKEGPHDDVTSQFIQESMLVKCTLQSFIFGIVYGLFFLNITDRIIYQQTLYFTGRWEYKSKKARIEHILTKMLICGIVLVIFLFALPAAIEITYFHYISYTVGSTLTGFSLIFFVPKIERIFSWIDYQNQNQEEIQQKQHYIGLSEEIS